MRGVEEAEGNGRGEGAPLIEWLGCTLLIDEFLMVAAMGSLLR
jgi:hypothetical protein